MRGDKETRPPLGWVAGTLADFATPRGEKALPSTMPESTFLGMDHVEAHTTKIIGGVPASKMKSAAARFYKGDVLYGRLRPYLNKVATPEFDGLASAEFIVFPNTELLRSDFLKHRLNASDFVSFAAHLNEGDRPRVDYNQIGEFPMILPPASEQRRIVAKIEGLFSELDKGVEALTTAREQLKAYRRSVLEQAVGGKLASSETPQLAKATLSSIVLEIGQGWSPRCLNHPALDEDHWAVVTTTAIQHGAFLDGENKQLPAELEPRKHLAIKVGDVLITRAGPRRRVGVACLVRKCRPRLMLCDKAYRLRPDNSLVTSAWLELVLNTPSVLREIEELKTGINDSGVNLTQGRFLALEVPLPSLAEQAKIVRLLEEKLEAADVMEAEIAAGLARAESLRQSILKRAFSGKLVPQDPKDEPASSLLVRIRAENAAAPPKRRERGGVRA